MQTGNTYFKSFIPVKIYQSASFLYMTCISKLPRNSFWAKCDQSLVIEQALVSAIDENLRPLDYEERQREAREILLKSQEKVFTKMNQSQSSTDQDRFTEDDEEDDAREPVRLKSEILLNEYQKLYEASSNISFTSILPKEKIKQYLLLLLSLFVVACSVFFLIQCGNHNYFL
ncbi:uncharacterized protein LOC108087768 [Drosophila ficusphila]|uniref:uncharacterized protein LOC108087768 n=1 Tax=Drosophila ficusphila TaxID=30025 RepID=UPI0007E7A8B8|nr:uncharacterized protein LOC108087768 [Drosophila ficusphila]